MLSIRVLGVKPKRRWYVFRLFFKIGLCSAISFKRSRWELSIDVAEHRSVWKNCQYTYYTRFNFIPKTGSSPKTCFVFTVLASGFSASDLARKDETQIFEHSTVLHRTVLSVLLYLVLRELVRRLPLCESCVMEPSVEVEISRLCEGRPAQDIDGR